MTYTRNEGVVVSGGTFTATNAAVGTNAQINHTQTSESNAMKEVQQRLDLLLQSLEEHGNQIPNRGEVAEAAQSVKEELTREKPNRLTLKSLLSGITDSVKSVSGVALAVEGLKLAVTTLLG
jgi:hypothetical protein